MISDTSICIYVLKAGKMLNSGANGLQRTVISTTFGRNLTENYGLILIALRYERSPIRN